MAHKNRSLPRPTPQVYAPPTVFQRQVSPLVISHALMQATSPQVYIPQNLPDLRLFYPFGPPYDHQTYEGTSFWSRSTSYYKRPPFMHYSRDPRIIPGASRVSNKNSPSESVDAVEHYCEVCKVSCVGKQSYTAHLAGQKHKKKSKQQEQQQMAPEERGKTKELQCPLCNIKCSGTDTYRAHLLGKQHQRAVKLQTARGSAVPDCEAVLAGADQKKWIFSPHVNLENCIEEVLVGKVVHFRCRLCDCTFSDVKAKNVHANGKKHQTALRRFKAASSLPFSSVSHSALPAQNDKASSSNSDSTASPQPVSPQGPPPTSSTCSISPSPIPSTSYFGGRSHVPPMGSTLARPPGPCVAPPGLQTPVSLPPHVLADERYMQTKLRRIAPSEEENALMTLAIHSVSDALRRILKARGDDADISNSSSGIEYMNASEPTGVFIVGAAAVGLLLGGQRTADMVLVSRELPSMDCVAEVAEELEELLKESCKNHSVTVATVEGTYVLVQMASKSTKPADNPSATDIMVTVRLRLTSTSILNTKVGTALKQPKSGADDHHHEGNTTAAATAAFVTDRSVSGSRSGGTHDDDDEQTQFSKALLCLSPGVCRDALTDMRQALWLQGAMAAHPAKAVLQNVARLMRCLIRDSQPLSWGHFPDYVLLVLLERLSYMDLAPPDVYHGAPARLRMGLLFRRLLECLSTGALIARDGELANLSDPVDTDAALLLANMKQEDRLAATSAAQMALRLVAFRQIYKLLDVPKFVPPCPSQHLPKNGVATKRRATCDCGFGGSSVHGCNYASAFVVNVTTSSAKVAKYHQRNREEERTEDANVFLTESPILF
ncbi:zinc finger rna binding protein [Echinococcus multilocularis]|uniref:Zinc finger rna binding protein n=1 Tax=Echinococcus multilocularis TaxID=6211 RepID=A0A068XVL4_ECHMU|nr:zinc finger rna binding protein [Echinococcus multilocularis]